MTGADGEDGADAAGGPALAVVCGPTAAGKSALALALADEQGAAILSADSRQLYRGFDLGTVPMSRAFASSCNTTFAELASRMPPRGLTMAAAKYGIGADYTIDGLTTVTGSVPPTVNLAERTEDGFGQGKVVVSPFGMALAAATVAAGKTPVPQLIEGRQTAVTGDQTPISPRPPPARHVHTHQVCPWSSNQP